MQYVGYAVYVVGLFITGTWVMGIRTYTSRGSPPMKQTVNSTMLFVVALVVVPAASLLPLHLLWMFPLGWFAGTLSLVFPFSLLVIPGQLFFQLACLGLDREQISRNKARLEKLQMLVIDEGITTEQARDKLIEHGEW